MPIIIKPVEILKNQDNIFQLDKDALAAESKVSSDAYFSDQANWKRVIVAYLTDVGNQVEFLTFDTSLETPVSNFRVSDRARDTWQVNALIIQDFDGGYLRFERSELTTAEFDVDFGEVVEPPPVVTDQSIIFDNSAYLTSSSDLLISGSPISISFWYKDDITDPAEKTIFESDTGIVITLTGNTFLQVDNNGPGGGGNIQFDTEYPADGKWHHIVLTAGPGVGGYLYIDGVVSDVDNLISLGGVELGNIYIGQGLFNTASKLTGSLATLEIWDGALSSSEVISLYNNGEYVSDPASVTTTTAILHHWSMGDDTLDVIEGAPNVTNTVIKDKIGNIDLQGAETVTSAGTLTASPDLPIADVFKSVVFDGTARLLAPSTISIADTMSISVWFKNEKSTGISGIFSSGSNSLGERSLYIDSANYPEPNIKLILPAVDSFSPHPNLVTPFPFDNNWHHAVIIVDVNGNLPNGDTFRLYIDNVYRGGSNTPVSQVNMSSLRIGTSNYGEFEGKISSFQVWNYALTVGDINSLYNNGSDLKNPSTVVGGAGLNGLRLLHNWSMGNNPDDEVFGVPDVANSIIIDQHGTNDLIGLENTATPGQGTLSFSSDVPLNFDQSLVFNNAAFLTSGATNLATINAEGTSSANLGVSLWFKEDITINGGSRDLFHQLFDCGGIKIYIESGILKANIGFQIISPISPYPADGSWNHIVLTAGSTSNSPGGQDAELYLNGVKIGGVDSVSPSAISLDSTLTVGWKPGSSIYNLAGKIASLEVWDGMLGITDISSIYNGGDYKSDPDFNVFGASLIRHFSMGDGPFDVATQAPNVTDTIIKDKVANFTLTGGEIAVGTGSLTFDTDLPESGS